MKIEVHCSDERGKGEHGWLHARHRFSFANYHNPSRMNFGLLRVLNQDIIEPGKGFGTHAHDNMEIVTIVLEGELEHKDSTGGHGVIRPGEVQSMSAGSGVMHSEFNHSAKDRVHLLQVWVDTKEQDIRPRYEQKKIAIGKNRLVTIASGKKGKGSVYIHQDSVFSRGMLEKSRSVEYKLSNRESGAYVFVISGEISIDKHVLKSSDAAAVTDTDKIDMTALKESDVLVIEVPME